MRRHVRHPHRIKRGAPISERTPGRIHLAHTLIVLARASHSLSRRHHTPTCGTTITIQSRRGHVSLALSRRHKTGALTRQRVSIHVGRGLTKPPPPTPRTVLVRHPVRHRAPRRREINQASLIRHHYLRALRKLREPSRKRPLRFANRRRRERGHSQPHATRTRVHDRWGNALGLYKPREPILIVIRRARRVRSRLRQRHATASHKRRLRPGAHATPIRSARGAHNHATRLEQGVLAARPYARRARARLAPAQARRNSVGKRVESRRGVAGRKNERTHIR